jgi:hypothetical protein
MRSKTPCQFRYAIWRVLLVLWTVLLVPVITKAGESDQPLLWKNVWPVLELFGLWLLYLFICWKARRRALEEKKAMLAVANRPSPGKQSFLWQAVLILLPVALMATFGFWAILRERNAIEQDAQQRAKEIIRALPSDVGRIAASRLTQLDGPKGGWFQYLQWAVAAWPENKMRKQWLADTNEAQIITNNLAALHTAFPGWHAGPVPLVSFWLDTNGNLSFENQVPPRPAAWLSAMSAEQRHTWAALQSAVHTSESLSNLVKAFQQMQPPPPALACVEFIQLRAGSQTLSPTNAINQLLRFAGGHYDDISESGVPLKTLALAEALKRAQDCGPTERLWDALQSEISSPGALTPILLDEAGRLVVKDAQLSEAVNAMRILLADKQAQSEMAEAVKQTGKVHSITTTNFWVDAMNRRWFCILSPSESQNHSSISNRPVTTITPIIQVACYPPSLVARGFAEVLADAEVSLPKYFSITLELEGDYLVKPFSTDELLARVRALLRRVERKTRLPLKLKLGEVEIDLARQTAMRGKKRVHLTAKEFAMLRLMAEAEGEPVTREKFLDAVWGYTTFPTTRTVDNHIASLRAKIELNPDSPRWIKTVHGVGYKLEL